MAAPALQGQKILVTGCTGQIGSALIAHLAPENEVWGLARFSDPEARARVEAAGARPHRADLAAADYGDLPTDFDYVVHLAAYQQAAGDYDHALTHNAEASGLLMAHCREAKAFLHAATAASYDTHPDPTHRYVETDPLGDSRQPYSPTYAISKLAGEGVVRTMARVLDLPATIARINVAYGADGGLPVILYAMMQAGYPVALKDAEPNLFNPVHHDDMAAHVAPFLEAASVPATIVNWGGDEVISVEDMCRSMGTLGGVEPTFAYHPVGIPGRAYDSTKRLAITGPCTIPWAEGARQIVEAYDPDIAAAQLARLAGGG